MRIDKAEVIVTSPDRNFVTPTLTTDDVMTGVGDATLNGHEQACAQDPTRDYQRKNG
jgi:mannonate dehydratase